MVLSEMTIYFNNIFIVAKLGLKRFSPRFQSYLLEKTKHLNYSEQEKTLYKKWYLFQSDKFMHQSIIDRTGMMKHPVDVDVSSFKHPDYKICNKDFSDIMCDRAKEILNISNKTGHRIMVFYSGGVDSTGLVCAFIKEIGIKAASEVIDICMSRSSVIENPNFFNDYIKPNFNIVNSYLFYNVVCKDEYKNSIFVTGDPAASLFGGGEKFRYAIKKYGSDIVEAKNYKDILQKIYDPFVFEYALENMHISSSQIGYKINDLYDYFWWYAMNYRYICQHFSMVRLWTKFFTENLHDAAYWKNHHISFYDSEDFSNWSYSSKEHLIDCLKNGIINNLYYKKKIKDFIFEFNKDKDYYLTKNKEAHLKKIASPGGLYQNFEECFFCLDSNYKVT